MDDVKVFLQDNWPYVVGGIIGLIIIMRFMGSRGGSDTAYAQLMAGNAAAMQASTQAGLANAQIEAQERMNLAEIELQRDALQARAQTDYLQASANMALAVGQSATGVIGQLYQPAIAAMQSAAYENAAVADAAAMVAVGGYTAQYEMTHAAAQATMALAQPAASASDIQQPPPQQGIISQVADVATALPLGHWSRGAFGMNMRGGSI